MSRNVLQQQARKASKMQKLSNIKFSLKDLVSSLSVFGFGFAMLLEIQPDVTPVLLMPFLSLCLFVCVFVSLCYALLYFLYLDLRCYL